MNGLAEGLAEVVYQFVPEGTSRTVVCWCTNSVLLSHDTQSVYLKHTGQYGCQGRARAFGVVACAVGAVGRAGKLYSTHNKTTPPHPPSSSQLVITVGAVLLVGYVAVRVWGNEDSPPSSKGGPPTRRRGRDSDVVDVWFEELDRKNKPR